MQRFSVRRAASQQLGTGETYTVTGPFRSPSGTRTPRSPSTRYDGHWQPGRTYLDGVDARIVTDPKAAHAALRSGRVEYSNAIGAGYFSIPTANGVLDNAVWTYEQPHEAVSEIKEYVAFYTDGVAVAPTSEAWPPRRGQRDRRLTSAPPVSE